MKAAICLLILNTFLLHKISEAQVIVNGLPVTASGPMPVFPPPTSTAQPSYFDRTAPKCYPETAIAYFLPAPPTSPKVTVLDPSSKDILSMLNSRCKEETKDVPLCKITEPKPNDKPAELKPCLRRLETRLDTLVLDELPSSRITTHPSFSPPSISGTPDLIDEVPSLIRKRLNRLAESEVKVCDNCCGLCKLPIYNFDQELLDGFLTGLGF